MPFSTRGTKTPEPPAEPPPTPRPSYHDPAPKVSSEPPPPHEVLHALLSPRNDPPKCSQVSPLSSAFTRRHSAVSENERNPMTTPPKFCRDCRHYQPAGQRCRRELLDLVTGESYKFNLSATNERSTPVTTDPCGTEGKHWQPKPAEPKPVKVSWWKRILQLDPATNTGPQ